MFKIVDNKSGERYGEIGQKNNLRWKLLYRTGESTMETQTGEIKCKDFFNDVVAFFKEGVKFDMYGFKNDRKKNDEGMYMLLRNVVGGSVFEENIEVLNRKLRIQLNAELSLFKQADDEYIVLLPNELWESTWRMSLVTMLIRCCNYGYKYEKWEDFFHTQAPMYASERAFNADTAENAKRWGFVLPLPYDKFWYFCGKDNHSGNKPKQSGVLIHNNGCVNWSTMMTMSPVKAAE